MPRGAVLTTTPAHAALREEEREAQPWRTGTLFLFTAAGVAICFGLIHVLLFPITGAIVLAVGLRLPHRWLRRHMGPSASATTLIVALCQRGRRVGRAWSSGFCERGH